MVRPEVIKKYELLAVTGDQGYYSFLVSKGLEQIEKELGLPNHKDVIIASVVASFRESPELVKKLIEQFSIPVAQKGQVHIVESGDTVVTICGSIITKSGEVK